MLGMSHEDKFRNQPSLTVDRDEGTCDGKELGSMEIIGLGELLFRRTELSTVYGAGLRKPRPKDTQVLSDVKLHGLRTESELYCMGAILTMDCFIFLLINHRSLESSLSLSLMKYRLTDFPCVRRNSSQMCVGRQKGSSQNGKVNLYNGR